MQMRTWLNILTVCLFTIAAISLLYVLIDAAVENLFVFTTDVDATGNVTSFVELCGEAMKFHKPGRMSLM